MKKIFYAFMAIVSLMMVACGPQPNTNGDVKSITLNKTEMIISEIGSERLTATTDPVGAQVTWESSDKEVATVATNGLVTAVGVGKCTITAKAGEATATCEVEVAGYFDSRVVSVESFLTMQAEKTGETFTSETSGNTYEWTNYTFLLMTNGMAYDREADDFIGPDQCPAFLIMGLGASDDQYIYILGDWETAESPLSEASTFEAGVIRNDTIYGSYMTECVMGAEGYHLDITLGNDENIVYEKQGSASFDGEEISYYNLDGHKCVRIPLTLVKEHLAQATKLTHK